MNKENKNKVKIKDKDALIKVFKTISWLDARRWLPENTYDIIHYSPNDLQNHEKILTHWLCYITNRQMSFEIVWEKGGFVFSEIVHEYSRNHGETPKEILDEYYEKYSQKGEDRFRFRSKTKNDLTFASRYITVDYQSILQTFEILDKYEVTINGKKYKRNIVAFILHFVERFKEKKADDLLMRVACALHLLAYQLENKKANPQKIIGILMDDNEFEKKLNKFKNTSTEGKKRLWCCVRDYKKGFYHDVFKNAINEVVPNNTVAEELINVWVNLPMDQIELPGDVWNNSPLFKEKLFGNVLDLNNTTWGMPKIIRDVYKQLKNEVKDFYPEQFDITFDFVPRMCNKKLCNVCLFGKNGVDSICIPSKDKYCPVALLTCGYIAKCEEEKCIIKSGISKGICKGAINED